VSFRAHLDSVLSLDCFENLVCSLSQSCIKLWDSKTLKLIKQATDKGVKRVVLFVNSGQCLNIWTGGGNKDIGQIDIWEWQYAKKSLSLQHTITVDCGLIQCMSLVALSYTIECVWVGSSEHIIIINPLSREVIAKWTAHPNCNVQALLAIGNNVWSYGNNKIIIWNKKSLEKLQELAVHQNPIEQLHLVQSTHGLLYVWSVYQDNTVVIWDSFSYKCLISTNVQGKRILSLQDNGSGGVIMAQQWGKGSIITWWEYC